MWSTGTAPAAQRIEQYTLSGSKGDIPPIKIIDFGTAVELEPGKFLVQKVGSPYYVAP
jgi:serine/threonine protein kinase